MKGFLDLILALIEKRAMMMKKMMMMRWSSVLTVEMSYNGAAESKGTENSMETRKPESILIGRGRRMPSFLTRLRVILAFFPSMTF